MISETGNGYSRPAASTGKHMLEGRLNDYEVEHDFPFIGKRSLLLNARRIPAPQRNPGGSC